MYICSSQDNNQEAKYVCMYDVHDVWLRMLFFNHLSAAFYPPTERTTTAKRVCFRSSIQSRAQRIRADFYVFLLFSLAIESQKNRIKLHQFSTELLFALTVVNW